MEKSRVAAKGLFLLLLVVFLGRVTNLEFMAKEAFSVVTLYICLWRRARHSL